MSRPITAGIIGLAPDRMQRLRARRISVDVEKLGKVQARLQHAELGAIEAEVQDLSVHGVALALPAELVRPGMLLTGDRIDALEVRVDDRVLFRGTGRVCRVSEGETRHVLGVELEGDGLDLAELHRQEARQTFLHRWEEYRAGMRADHVQPAFKAFVADLRTELEALRDFLDAEERALSNEDQLSRSETIGQYIQEIHPRILAAMDSARSRLGVLVDGFTEEEHSVHRAFLKRHLLPLFAASPFMRRCFQKPLGYAGDYEMMNMLYRDHAEGETLFGKSLNLYATSETAALANINRLSYLAAKIVEQVEQSDRERVRIASVGCGPAREIHKLLTERPELGRRLEVALIDQEERSIAYCERSLAPLVRTTGVRVQFIRESVRKLLTSRELGMALGEREFVYSAGLFDYLSDRSFTALLQVLWSALAGGGKLAVGNVSRHNPSRWTMEYFSEWFLNHRGSDDLLLLSKPLDPAPRAIRVESEPTGVNLFLILER